MAVADPALWGRTRLPARETTVLGQQSPSASFVRRDWSCPFKNWNDRKAGVARLQATLTSTRMPLDDSRLLACH